MPSKRPPDDIRDYQSAPPLSRPRITFAADGIHLAFGRHEGENICAVPESYLEWILREIVDEEDEHVAALRAAAAGEIDQRKHAGVLSFDF